MEVLRTKDDLDQIKTKVLFEIMEGLIVRDAKLIPLESEELAASRSQQEDHQDCSQEGVPLENYIPQTAEDIASERAR